MLACPPALPPRRNRRMLQDARAVVRRTRSSAAAQAGLRHPPRNVDLDEAALAHPADLDGLALLGDQGDGAVAVRELEHAFVGLAVLFDVVLDEVHPAPLQVIAGSCAVRTTRRDVELYQFGHAASQILGLYLPDSFFVALCTLLY